jgi:DNA-binding NarL/FixJ family response regulator
MTETLQNPRRLVIVDDHPIVRKGIQSLLKQEPDLEICGEAESAGEALDQIRELQPDAAIIDISLKGTDGIELTKSIRAEFTRLPILIMSMHDESIYAERVLRSGANGYIMKQEVADNVVNALRTVLKGDIYVSDDMRQTLLGRISGRSEPVHTSPIDRLSDRELEVFRLIGQGFGTRQIAKDLHLSVKTIETYRAHIKEKLGIDSATELVRQAVQLSVRDGGV